MIKTLAKLFLIFLVYNLIANVAGGLNLDFGQLYFELPLYLASTLLLSYAISKTPRWHHTLIASLPWLIVYGIMDAYFMSLGRVFKWAEIVDLPELYDILPLYLFAPIVLVPLLLVAILAMAIQRWRLAVAGLLVMSIPLVMAFFLPAQYTSGFERFARSIYIDERMTVGQNGRWTTGMYFEASRKAALATLAYDPEWAQARNERIAGQISNPKNIHIIVMESWLDPTLMAELNSEPFISDQLNALTQAKNFSESPVFGGQTPQAEFEILCATPAQQAFGTIEFNTFAGGGTSCLPNWLSERGYQTIATHAYKTTFFNRPAAYRSLGFEQAFFPKDYAPNRASYLPAGMLNGQKFMFDGPFLDANLAYISEQLQAEQPVFNYVLGVYGHWPNGLDYPGQEVFAEISDYPQLNRVAAQYYYRTQALADYLKALIETDPDSIILVASDHLPPIDDMEDWVGDTGYPGDQYRNIYYLFIDGQPVSLADTSHDKMIAPIMAELCDGQCSLPVGDYDAIMAGAAHRR